LFDGRAHGGGHDCTVQPSVEPCCGALDQSMSVSATTHVNFRGQARAALEFYRAVFGGEISIATYADIHSVDDHARADDVAFGRLDAPSGSDAGCRIRRRSIDVRCGVAP
jgi:hypothetical protein